MTNIPDPKPDDTYTEKEAEQRFEKTVSRMLKTPPKHHKKGDKKEHEADKGLGA